MTEKNNEKELKDIDSKTKEEIYFYYYKQFGYLIPNLTKAFADVINSKDVLALCFLIDVFSSLSKRALKELELDSDDNEETTWLSPKPGKC